MMEHLQGLSMSQLNDMHASMLLTVVSPPRVQHASPPS